MQDSVQDMQDRQQDRQQDMLQDRLQDRTKPQQDMVAAVCLCPRAGSRSTIYFARTHNAFAPPAHRHLHPHTCFALAQLAVLVLHLCAYVTGVSATCLDLLNLLGSHMIVIIVVA